VNSPAQGSSGLGANDDAIVSIIPWFWAPIVRAPQSTMRTRCCARASRPQRWAQQRRRPRQGSSRCPAPTASDTSAPISPWAKVVLATAASGVAISAVEGRLAPRDLVDRRRAGFAGDRPSAAILGSRSVEGGIRALRSIRSRRLRSARRPACPRMTGSIRSKAVRTVDHHADILYIDLDGAVFCVLFASRMRAPSPPKL
jgi:hypothetical protein